MGGGGGKGVGRDTTSGMTVLGCVCDDGHGLEEPNSCQQKDFPSPIHQLQWFARPQLFNVVMMGGTDRDGIRSGEGWGGWIERWSGSWHREANFVIWNTRDRQQSRNPTRLAHDGGHGARECCIVGTQTAGLMLACMSTTNRLCEDGHDLALPVETLHRINSCPAPIRLLLVPVMGYTVVYMYHNHGCWC